MLGCKQLLHALYESFVGWPTLAACLEGPLRHCPYISVDAWGPPAEAPAKQALEGAGEGKNLLAICFTISTEKKQQLLMQWVCLDTG